jgi:hypothetical protein
MRERDRHEDARRRRGGALAPVAARSRAPYGHKEECGEAPGAGRAPRISAASPQVAAAPEAECVDSPEAGATEAPGVWRPEGERRGVPPSSARHPTILGDGGQDTRAEETERCELGWIGVGIERAAGSGRCRRCCLSPRFSRACARTLRLLVRRDVGVN